VRAGSGEFCGRVEESILDNRYLTYWGFCRRAEPGPPAAGTKKQHAKKTPSFWLSNRQFAHRFAITAARAAGGTASHFRSPDFFACLCTKTQCRFLFLLMYWHLDKGIPGASR
jgi:hypothetical protein